MGSRAFEGLPEAFWCCGVGLLLVYFEFANHVFVLNLRNHNKRKDKVKKGNVPLGFTRC